MVRFPRLRAMAAGIVMASMPTLSIGCIGHSNYVVPMSEGQSCEMVCGQLAGRIDRASGVDACTAGSWFDPASQQPEGEQPEGQQVAICRIVISGPGGRRPPGLRSCGEASMGEVGGWLAEMARLEAASVPAFEQLARELEAHGAPRSLVAASHRARADEARHARTMSKWRDRYGGDALEVLVDPTPVRELEAIAIENAREGCAGEMFGALVGLHQSSLARDPELRRDMAVIAEDELRHAHLSLRVDAWASARLGSGARRRVREARDAALEALSASRPIAEASRLELGLPDLAATARLAAGCRALLS